MSSRFLFFKETIIRVFVAMQSDLKKNFISSFQMLSENLETNWVIVNLV